MIKLTRDISLENYTLILPSVAVGNVGQLAIDLLIANLNLQKIGQIFSTAFVPIVGANAYHEQSNELVTAIDIYAGTKERVVVVQIRSPYVAELTEFFDELRHFVTEKKIAKVIVLTSSYDYEKREVQPNPLKLRYIASPAIQTENGKLFDDLNWIPHKPKDDCDSGMEGRLQIPGGGFARSIFNFLSDANISCAILFKFCSEGDNTSDALLLVHYLDQWIDVLGTRRRSVTWKFPPSWKNLFGRPAPYGMY